MTSAPFIVAPASAIDYLIVESQLSADSLTELQKVCDTVMVATP
jgi:hypothetical protein